MKLNCPYYLHYISLLYKLQECHDVTQSSSPIKPYIFLSTGDDVAMYKSVQSSYASPVLPVQEPRQREDFLKCESLILFSAVTQFTPLGAYFCARSKLGADDVLRQTLWLTTKSDCRNCCMFAETGIDYICTALWFRCFSFVCAKHILQQDVLISFIVLYIRFIFVCGQTHKRCWFLWHSRS